MNRIYTIGHSTRTLDELVALLREHSVTRLADVRRYPGSRRHPHFSRESLQGSFAVFAAQDDTGIVYEHFEDLGGRRTPAKDSRNMAWENEQFRGYADYMCTDEFKAAVDRLLDSERETAVMCAEAVPWRCHRNLLADELVRRGIEVLHIVGPGSAQPHKLSKMARIAGDCVLYPPEQAAMF
jgi:uncharacterized protein (DUF488 family)